MPGNFKHIPSFSTISGLITFPNKLETMRTPGVDKNGLRQGAWSPEEDQKLIDYISRYRIWTWSFVARFAGLSRSGKSCRLRWVNYLDPKIRRGNINNEEEKIIIEMYAKLGSRWSKIASRLPGRTDNEIKNYWHTRLKKLSKDEPKKSIEPLVMEIPKFQHNLENKYGIHNISTSPSASTTSKASNSQDSHSPTMTPNAYECLFSSNTSTRGSDEIQERDQVGNCSSEPVGDLHSFWAQPFFTGNAFMEYEQPEIDVEDWYQEPLSPCTIFNNEYWLNEFGVMDGMEQPNDYNHGKF